MFGLSIFSTVFYQFTLEEAIRRTSKAGYKGIDLMAVRPHAWPNDYTKSERKDMLKRLKSVNLEVPTVTNFGAAIGLNPSSPKEKIRKEAIDYLKDCIDLAYDLESKTAMLIPGWFLLGDSPEKAWKWAVEGLKECLDHAEDKSITIAIEPALNLFDSVESVIRMKKEVGSKNIRICLDTLHTALDLKTTLEDSISKVAHELVHFHVWDIDAKGQHVPFGKGKLDFNKIVTALKRSGYNGYLSVECMPFAFGISDPDEYARESKKFLFEIMRNL